MRKNTSFLLVACLMTISTLIGGCSSMQNKAVNTTSKYPERPITMIVPFSAGGGLDLIARAMEKQSIKYLGQPLVIVNKPGGAGTIGWNELSKATPDGYTIGMFSSDMLLPPLYNKNEYTYYCSLDPLTQITATPMVIAVKADQPIQSLNDLIEYAKEHPGKVKFGHAGIGSFPHIVGEMLAHSTNTNIEQVPFRGASESTAALLGGHIQAALASQTIFNEYIKSGTIKILATTGVERAKDPLWSKVPTFSEQGYNIIFSNRFGVAAPKELPPEVKTKLLKGLKKMIADPEFQKDVEGLGLQVEYSDSDETQTYLLSDKQNLDKAVNESGVIELIKSQKK